MLARVEKEVNPKMKKLSDSFYSYSNRKKELTTIAIEQLTSSEEDLIVSHYSDIIDPDYRVWFIKRLRVIGKPKFVKYGDMARKYGRNKQKYFTSLVKG